MKNKKIIIGIWITACLVFVIAILLFAGARKGKLEFLPNQNQKTDIPQNNSNSTSVEEKKSDENQVEYLPKNLPDNLKAKTLKSKDGENKDDATFIAYADGNKLTVVIETKLPEPASKEHYAAWLVKNSGQGYFKLGKLEKVNNNFGISASLDGSFSEYKTAIVTLETLDDNTPEKVILEGNL